MGAMTGTGDEWFGKRNVRRLMLVGGALIFHATASKLGMPDRQDWAIR